MFDSITNKYLILHVSCKTVISNLWEMMGKKSWHLKYETSENAPIKILLDLEGKKLRKSK